MPIKSKYFIGVNIPIDPKKIAKFCFLVVLCQVGSSLQHTKSWTKLEYGKVSNFEADFFRFGSFSYNRFTCGELTWSVFMMSHGLSPSFSGAVFHTKGFLVMLNHSLDKIYGYSCPCPPISGLFLKKRT